MNHVAARTFSFTRARTRVQEMDPFWPATVAIATALAAVLAWFLDVWPPHEDEGLALFVGRGSLGEVLQTVIGERGGAPLHFVIAWTVVQLGGGLTALRAVSLVFAVASIPLIALLGARLAGRAAGITAALLASATWIMLFNGVYGRMYSLFLFTSALSYLALLWALERGGPRRFACWGASLLLVLATHPYSLFVASSQVLFVLARRTRVRAPLATFAAVAVLGTPFWWADVVLRDRFDVGVGGGGTRLGSPGALLQYFWSAAGDFSVGRHAGAVAALLIALVGATLLALRRPQSVLLIGCVLAVPAIALMLATLGPTTSPETRHLIFALPFFTILLAVPLVEVARARPPLTAGLAVAAVLVLVVAEARWAHARTPELFDGDAVSVVRARERAAAWLASTARPDDVLLGYEPLFLRAWEQNRSFSPYVLPRADPRLLAAALRDVPQPLGRGIWVFDASDSTNAVERETIPLVLPEPARLFEARVYGPYLVIRSREPIRSPARYLTVSERVMNVGRALRIGDANVNLQALRGARSRF